MGDSRERSTPRQLTGDDIIAEILRNFDLGFFPIRYTTLVPCRFQVYLHAEEFDQIRPVASQLEQEARRALAERLAELNHMRLGLAERLGFKPNAAASRTEYKALEEWSVEFLPDQEGQLGRGDLEVFSELGSAPREEYGVGSMTRRITRRQSDGRVSSRAEVVELAPTRPLRPVAAPAPVPVAVPEAALPVPATESEPAAPTTRAAEQTHGWLRYEDQGGRREFAITKDLVVIGRGGRAFWVDVKLDTLPDVSREHCRIRRDPVTGGFFLKDLSQFGTTVNGTRVPSSVEMRDGTPYDKNIEVPLPAQARIELAGALEMEFQAGAAR